MNKSINSRIMVTTEEHPTIYVKARDYEHLVELLKNPPTYPFNRNIDISNVPEELYQRACYQRNRRLSLNYSMARNYRISRKEKLKRFGRL